MHSHSPGSVKHEPLSLSPTGSYAEAAGNICTVLFVRENGVCAKCITQPVNGLRGGRAPFGVQDEK